MQHLSIFTTDVSAACIHLKEPDGQVKHFENNDSQVFHVCLNLKLMFNHKLDPNGIPSTTVKMLNAAFDDTFHSV